MMFLFRLDTKPVKSGVPMGGGGGGGVPAS